jgi:branched-chain amino acid transport system permease protein
MTAPDRLPPLRAYAPVVSTAAVLAAVPLALGGSRYLMSLASTALVFAAYAIGMNVIFGSSGQLFLCLGALAGVAGYTSALLADERAWPLALSVPIGVALATAIGALFSWVAVRRNLEVIFVGIVTLAFSLVFTNLVQGLRTVTGGETGRVVDTGGVVLRGPITSYYLFLGVVVAFLACYRWLERSRTGWAWRALKDDPVAAELAGVDVARARILAGAIGAAMVGLTGALFAHHEAFISPTSYAFAHVDVRVLIVVAFGGIGSLLGPVVGAVALGVIDEVLRPLGQLRLAVYGALLIALFLGVRRGVVPTLGSLFDLGRRPSSDVPSSGGGSAASGQGAEASKH